MKIKLQTEVLDYARALRAIGQDLSKLIAAFFGAGGRGQ
jgi:hypothetical protein